MCRKIGKSQRFITLCLGILFGVLIQKILHNLVYPNTGQEQKPDIFNITCLLIVSNFKNVKVANSTWVQDCDNSQFVKLIKVKKLLSEAGSSLRTPAAIKARSSWAFLCKSLRKLPLSKTQWLIVVPDKLLVILRNLRKYLLNYDWREGHYFGHAVSNYIADYNDLSAGIVLSHGALTNLLKKFNSDEACERSGQFWNNGDILLGKFLNDIGVKVKDTRDIHGSGRFHGFNINTLMHPGPLFKQNNYYKRALFPTAKAGIKCCSKELITLATSDADHLMVASFLLSTLKVGEKTASSLESPPIDDKMTWQKALEDINYKGSLNDVTAEKYYDIWAAHMSPEDFNKKLRDSIKL